MTEYAQPAPPALTSSSSARVAPPNILRIFAPFPPSASITLWFCVQCVRSIMHSLMSKHAIRKLHTSSIYNSNVYMHAEYMQRYATLEMMLMCEHAKRSTVESRWRGIIWGSVFLKRMIKKHIEHIAHNTGIW